MKKLTLIISAFSIAFEIYSQTPSEMGLVGDYPFNNNAKDMSLSKNDGQVVGATLTNDRFGKQNSAYYFNGYSYILFPAKNILNNYYSISAWVKINQLPTVSESAAGIVNIGNVGGDQFLYISSQFGFSMINYVKNNPPMNYSVGVLPLVDKWYHLTVTRNDKYLIFYIDGELKGLMTVQNFVPEYSDNPVGTIGARLNGSKQFFHGTIDDVKIFSRALSETEVVALFKTEVVTGNNKAELLVQNVNLFQDNLYKNKFNIEAENFTGDVVIANMQGRIIFETKIINLNGVQNIEISPSYKGTYVFNLININGQSVSKRFIIL